MKKDITTNKKVDAEKAKKQDIETIIITSTRASFKEDDIVQDAINRAIPEEKDRLKTQVDFKDKYGNRAIMYYNEKSKKWMINGALIVDKQKKHSERSEKYIENKNIRLKKEFEIEAKRDNKIDALRKKGLHQKANALSGNNKTIPHTKYPTVKAIKRSIEEKIDEKNKSSISNLLKSHKLEIKQFNEILKSHKFSTKSTNKTTKQDKTENKKVEIVRGKRKTRRERRKEMFESLSKEQKELLLNKDKKHNITLKKLFKQNIKNKKSSKNKTKNNNYTAEQLRRLKAVDRYLKSAFRRIPKSDLQTREKLLEKIALNQEKVKTINNNKTVKVNREKVQSKLAA